MVVWRISNHTDLAGLGGERGDARWHTAARGKRIVYLAEHPAVALVETLVQLRGNAGVFPDRLQLLKVAIPDGVGVEEVRVVGSMVETQATGDEWLAEGRSALLRVPSVPTPESWNYLLNPLHGEARGAVIEWARSVAYDRRLIRSGGG